MTDCDSICIGEWMFVFLWFVSVPTYSMVIYTIWKHRKTKFKEEFWLLTMSLFTADLLLLCQHMWAFRMAAWGLLPSAVMRAPKVVGWFIHVPGFAFGIAQAMGVVFLSLNRYMAIVKPVVNSLWNRKVTIACICAQWGMGLIAGLSLVPMRFHLVQNMNDSGFTAEPDERHKKMAMIVIGVAMGLGGLVRVLLFIILYGHMFYYVYKQNRVVGAVHVQNDRPSQRGSFNLAVIGALLALCDMANTLHSFDVAIHMEQISKNAKFMTFRGACLSDIYGWMNGWLLLAFASAVRKQFLKQYGCKKNTVNSVTR